MPGPRHGEPVVDGELGDAGVGVGRNVGELQRRLAVELDRLHPALQVLGRLHLEIADRVGYLRQRRRQDGELGARRQAMQQAAADRGGVVLDDDRPLHDGVGLFGAEHARVELALEQRRRTRAAVGRILLQHRLAELAVGDIRVFGELGKDGEGEQPEALGIRIALRQRHLRRRLDGLRRIEGDQLALGDRLGAGRRQVEGRHALAVLVDGARGGLRRLHLGLGNAEIGGLDLALALVGLGAAGRRARMAAVEDGPDEGALVADRVERRADLVVHQRVGHALVAVDPLVDVLRQEDFVEPVGLVAGLGLRLLRAMARQMQVDEVVALDLGRKVWRAPR